MAINYENVILSSIYEIVLLTKSLLPENDISINKRSEEFYVKNNVKKRTKLLKRIVKDCELEGKKLKILDIGPAEGIIPRALKKLGHDVYVLEHSECNPDLDKKSYYDGMKLSECVIQKGEFPFEDNFFDVVMNFGVMEHIEPPTCYFWNESYRILKPEGLLFMDNPNPINLRKRIFTLLGRNPNNEIVEWLDQRPIFTGHYREHTLDELVYCAEKTGFTVEKEGAFNFILDGYYGNASFLKKIALRAYGALTFTDHLKDTLYIVAKK